MKKIAKLGALVLAVIMLLCGCGTTAAPAAAPAAPAAEAPAAEAPAAEVPAAPADDWPKDPITLIVPFSAGGSIDTLCRTLGPYLTKELGVDVVVEDMPGAGSQVGLTYLADTASKDGYTISEVSEPHLSFSINVQKAGYTTDDFAYFGMIQVDPCAIIVKNESKFTTMLELIDYIKANPGEIAIGCTQMSGPQVIMLYMQKELGLDFTIVPYEGGGEGRAALIGDHIDVYFGMVQANYSMNDIGRCLAVCAPERSALWPDAPTLAEILPEETELADIAFMMASYRTIAAPAEFKAQYPERFDKLAAALEKIFNDPAYQEDCKTTGQYEIMEWHNADETTEMLKSSFELLSEMAQYFE